MSGLRKSLVLGLAASIVGLVFSIIPFGLDLEEEAGLALLFKLRGPKSAPSDVVVVSIDKASADRLGLLNEPRKWPRSLHAELTETLAEQGAAAVAFDIFFEEPRSAADDTALAEAMKKAGNVVLSHRLLREKIDLSDSGAATIEKIVPPLPQLADAALAGAPFPLPKIPVRVGQDWTFKAGSGDMPTMPVVAFQAYALDVYDSFIILLKTASPKAAEGLPADRNALVSGGNLASVVRTIRQRFEADPLVAGRMLTRLKAARSDFTDEKQYNRLRSLILMYKGEGIRYLNYYGPAGTVTTVPYDQALSGRSAVDFKGKAVFVGFSELYQPEQKDSFYTVYSTKDGTDLSGVEIGATEFSNLLDASSLRPILFYDHVVLAILWGFALGFCFVRLSMVVSLVASMAIGAAYLAFAFYQFTENTLWYPLVMPLFLQLPLAFVGATVWKYVDASRERRNIRAAFGHYLPDDVIDRVAKDITKIGS
ncbi:MAG: CHASE2 domain-containing protein, partial [Nitrospirota bacterium]|nr:CHASE2 domain-containing protein [Nitrospirota bacterium]